jgi:hypothetical protein
MVGFVTVRQNGFPCAGYEQLASGHSREAGRITNPMTPQDLLLSRYPIFELFRVEKPLPSPWMAPAEQVILSDPKIQWREPSDYFSTLFFAETILLIYRASQRRRSEH